MPRTAPEAFETVIFASLGREDVDEQVAVIGQHPLGLAVAFDVVRHLAGVILQAEADLVADGLHLLRIGAGADDEVVGERGDTCEVQDYDVGGLLGFGCADGNQPGWYRGLGGGGWFEIGLGQIRLLDLSYYGGDA